MCNNFCLGTGDLGPLTSQQSDSGMDELYHGWIRVSVHLGSSERCIGCRLPQTFVIPVGEANWKLTHTPSIKHRSSHCFEQGALRHLVYVTELLGVALAGSIYWPVLLVLMSPLTAAQQNHEASSSQAGILPDCAWRNGPLWAPWWHLEHQQEAWGEWGQLGQSKVSYREAVGRSGANWQIWSIIQGVCSAETVFATQVMIHPWMNGAWGLCPMHDTSTFVLLATFQRRQKGKVGENTSVWRD